MPPQQGKDDEENWSDEEGETLASAGISNVWVWLKVGGQQLAALLKFVVPCHCHQQRLGQGRRGVLIDAPVARVGEATPRQAPFNSGSGGWWAISC